MFRFMDKQTKKEMLRQFKINCEYCQTETDSYQYLKNGGVCNNCMKEGIGN